jgi:co-chaperonin GroES (HSP10)
MDVKREDRQLIVVGDRVLLRADDGEAVTGSGLILPDSVADRENAGVGRVVAVGPGMAMPPSGFAFDEEWEKTSREPRWVAVQARVGDVAVFFRKAAAEVQVDGQKLFVVSHSAILLLLREGSPGDRAHVI